MKTSRLSSFAAAVSLALASVGAVHAADSSAPDAPAAASVAPGSSTPATGAHRGGHHMHKGGRHHWMRNGVMIPGVGVIGQKQVAQLKLNADQQKLVQTAQDEEKSLRESMMKAGKERHEQVAAQIKANKLDPHALVSQSESGRGQFKSGMDSVRIGEALKTIEGSRQTLGNRGRGRGGAG